MSCRYVDKDVTNALATVEESINTFCQVLDDNKNQNKISDVLHSNDVSKSFKYSNFNTQTHEKELHKFLGHVLESVKLEDNDDSTDAKKYYMPNFCKWLHEKLLYITLWSNLCLGDLQRFNPEYDDCKLPETKTNSVAEQFFFPEEKQ